MSRTLTYPRNSSFDNTLQWLVKARQAHDPYYNGLGFGIRGSWLNKQLSQPVKTVQATTAPTGKTL
jgi:hypothetical protein